MAACQQKGCVYQAVSGKPFCQMHSPAPITTKPDDDIQIVEIKAVPRSGRFNEAAMKLCGAAKALDPGHAIKVKVGKFSKPTLFCAQRYAKDEGLRIGVRITGEFAYVWKLTTEELAAIDAKAQRMLSARNKRAAKAGKG